MPIKDEAKTLIEIANAEAVTTAGRLGAIVTHPELAEAARIDMIERRILRIETALRRAGVEVERVDLPPRRV